MASPGKCSGKRSALRRLALLVLAAAPLTDRAGGAFSLVGRGFHGGPIGDHHKSPKASKGHTREVAAASIAGAVLEDVAVAAPAMEKFRAITTKD
ncbi:unnamed protein product, partial [Symbiodinium necroappetens]